MAGCTKCYLRDLFYMAMLTPLECDAHMIDSKSSADPPWSVLR